MKSINQFCKSHKKEIFLFFLMIALEFAMIFVLSQKNGLTLFFRSDGTEYQTIVKNIVSNGVFSLDKQAPFIPTDYRTPGYPFWLAFVYIIFKSFIPAIFIGAVVFALSAPLAYLIGKEIFTEKIAFLGAVIFALEPWAIFQGGFLTAEQIFLPLLLFSMYLFCKYLKSENNMYVYCASLFLGVTALIRPAALYFILIFVFLALVNELKYSIFKSLKTSVFTILIFIAVLSPWLVRNKMVLNTWQLSSAASNGVLYIESYMLNKYLGKIGDEHEWEKAAQILGTYDFGLMKRAENTKILADYAIKEIKTNKAAFIIMHLKNMALFLVKNSYGNIFLDLKIKDANIQSKIGAAAFKKDFFGLFNLIKDVSAGAKNLTILFFFWPIIIICATFGTISMFKKNYQNLLFWFLIFWILYFLAMSADFHDISRYKLSINAPLIMLAVFGFHKIKNLITKRLQGLKC